MTQPAAVRMVLPGSSPPWTSTGTEVCRGDRVTLLGSGRINWSENHWGGAKYHLWGRVAVNAAVGAVALRPIFHAVAAVEGPRDIFHRVVVIPAAHTHFREA